jgi:2-dehydropantoate 2-reductase
MPTPIPRTANPKRIAVLGPGGVGGLLAAVLSQAGHDVLCLASETTAKTIRDNGIRLSSPQFGDFTARVGADTSLEKPVDACIIAVKHTAFPSALERVPPECVADGVVVPLLNGFEHPAVLRERYRPETVLPATIRVESTRVESGVIEHASPFADVELASKTAPAERVEDFAGVLREAGFGVAVQADETSMLWSKLLFLAPAALLTTTYAAPLGAVVAEHWDQLYAALAETAAVARACGADVDTVRASRQLRTAPASFRSSMQRDAEAGRPTELDAIGGAVLRAAVLHDVPVPTLTAVISALAVKTA